MVPLVGASCNSGDGADGDFDTTVERPAYVSSGPHVVFDEAHHNRHRARGTYGPFVRLLEADGYHVSVNAEAITDESLQDADVLVVAGAMGTNARNDDDAFDRDECAHIDSWVSRGGALLLITDHYPFGDAVEELARRLGVSMSKGVVEDTVHYAPNLDPTHIVFSKENGGLGEHAIVHGRSPDEAVYSVLTFTGQAVTAAPPAVAILKLSPSAFARPARPVVVRDGRDVRVQVEYGDPEPIHGWAQAVALTHGKGRVVVAGEAAMLTAQRSRYDGSAIGMNVTGFDNRQLALNIVRWLSGAL